MPRTPTLENPFAPEKHRSTDDPALVGKILGAEAEAAMRRTVADKAEGAEHAERKDDLALTDTELAKIAEEKEKRERSSEWKMEQARKELIVWAKEIDKDEEWAIETFTIHPDGTLTVEGDLDLRRLPVSRLPKGLTRIEGYLNFFDNYNKILSDNFPPPEDIGKEILFTLEQSNFAEELRRRGYKVSVDTGAD